MGRYVTLGADERGEVYGLELGKDGRWKRNSLGLSTSCKVIRPLSRENYEYMTEDPESVKEFWQAAVQDGKTELGLADWFCELDKDDLLDTSFVFELLDDEDNPTVLRHSLSIKKRIDEEDESDDIWGEDGQPISFREHVKKALLESPDTMVSNEDDIYDWECSGWFPPHRPFVVEFAPKELLEEYYAHLRKVGYEGWK